MLTELQCDFSNQGQPTEFSSNVANIIVQVNNSFPSNYTRNQAVHYKGNRIVVSKDNLLKDMLTSTVFIRHFVENFVGWPWLD